MKGLARRGPNLTTRGDKRLTLQTMHTRSKVEFGNGTTRSFSTTSGSSFTRLAENLPSEAKRKADRDSHIFWGTDDNSFEHKAQQKKIVPDLHGLSKEEIIAKHKDTSVNFGDEQTVYTTSNPVSKHFEAAILTRTRNRKHLDGVHITHKDNFTSMDETKEKIYKDAVTFGSESVEWTTESASQFCEQKDGLQAPIIPDSFTTNWSTGADEMDWKTTTSSSFGIVKIPTGKETKRRTTTDVNKSKVQIGNGTNQRSFATCDIFSKTYSKFDDVEAHEI